MTNYVLVLDAHRRPLAPCRPARARILLRKGRAAVFRRYPFTIILKHVPTGPIRRDFELKVDPGSRCTGLAIVSHGRYRTRCVVGINLHHRGPQIKGKLQDRAVHRRARRARNLRYRPARFDNRTRAEGWLPPSVHHRYATTRTWTDRLGRWVPITRAAIEEVKFDTQKLRNPEIQGRGYQQGKLYNTQMREFLLYTYRHTCQYCKGASKDPVLEWEHRVPKSRGGSDALNNATLGCQTCNRHKGSQTPEEWLRSMGRKVMRGYLRAVQLNIPKLPRQHPPLRDAAVMNAIRYRLYDYCIALGLQPILTPGWVTKRCRLDTGYRKDHWIDAVCVGGVPVYIAPTHRPLRVQATGTTRRQMCLTDAYGFPRTRAKGPSRVQGFRTGDHVRAVLPKGRFQGTHEGRVAVRSSGACQIGQAVANTRYLVKLHASDGYRYQHGDPVTQQVVVGAEQTLPYSRYRTVQNRKLLTNGDRVYTIQTHLLNSSPPRREGSP